MPPTIITPAMAKSMARLRHCASAPDMEEAVTWESVVATATVDGIPANTNNGVIRKPPPTPNMPERKPTPVPSAIRTSQLTDISATGRYISISQLGDAAGESDHARATAGGQRPKPH